ncbi:hypothetical protein ANN_15216 [Periplaneta americana]|uniref:PiggyBac transposable element-derived protein domain-containing protein n=1 Tax=Periplaneta americana TaxID=6978 RepID=A0ABQ8SFR5_PERAM|nr:hypothetical protein ANN_15216 [Periplaneta americana]
MSYEEEQAHIQKLFDQYLSDDGMSSFSDESLMFHRHIARLSQKVTVNLTAHQNQGLPVEDSNAAESSHRKSPTPVKDHHLKPDCANGKIPIPMGILIWMGLVRYPKLENYWSKRKIYDNYVKKLTSRNRFKLLLCMWHFHDNENLGKYQRFGNCLRVIVSKWKDKREVLMLTTGHGDETVTVQKHGKEITKPKVIIDYNNSKAFIDLSDQLKVYNTSLRRGIKWYRKLANEMIFGTTIVNAQVIYSSHEK